MDYRETKIKGIIREGFVKILHECALIKLGNPYASIQECDIEINHNIVNKHTEKAYNDLKEKGLI